MGRKCIDLTKQKFNRLTVIERQVDYKGKYIWLCKCECGNETMVRGYDLTSGKVKSCGCLQKECAKTKAKDLTGKTFNRLTVVKRAGSTQKGLALWLCKCECGNEKIVSVSDLQRGKVKSCGCYNSEKASELWKELWQNKSFIDRHKQRHYKGGITIISNYLRGINLDWYDNCKKQANYKCQLTNKHSHNLNTHHLYGFSNIVLDAHENYNIPIREVVADYTEKELKLLEDYVAKWHKDNSNAVVLDKKVHDLFHKLYGKGNNTPEQFEEFKERYLAGEFKEILK